MWKHLSGGLLLGLLLSVTACAGSRSSSKSTAPGLSPAASYSLALNGDEDFSGCVVSEANNNVQLSCGEEMLIFAESITVSTEEFVGLMRDSLEEGGEGTTVTEDPVAFKVDGTLYTAARLTARSKEDPTELAARLFLMTLTAPGESPRGAICLTPSEEEDVAERCLRQIATLVLQGVPDGLQASVQEPAPTFMGRELEIVEGCEAGENNETLGRIDCEEGSLAWFLLPDEEGMEAILSGVRQEFEDPKSFEMTSRDVACELDGHSTQCLQYVGKMADGTPTNVLVGHAEIEGIHVAALCLSANSNDHPHPVCATLLTLP